MFTRESIHARLLELLAEAQAQGDSTQLDMGLEALIEALSPVRQFHRLRPDRGPLQYMPVPDSGLFLGVLRQIKLARDYMVSAVPSWQRAEQCIREALAKFDEPKSE